jgi:hypothetical protein
MKRRISPTFYYVKTRDRVGGTVRTDVFQQENGTFEAYYFYAQDEDESIVGFAESMDDLAAIKSSRKNLRKEWKVELYFYIFLFLIYVILP